MRKCITSNGNGIINRLKLLVRTVSLIFKSAPLCFVICLISELLIGLLQTWILIAWQHVNYFDDIEYIMRTVQYAEALTTNKVIALSLFPFERAYSWNSTSSNLKVVDYEE